MSRESSPVRAADEANEEPIATTVDEEDENVLEEFALSLKTKKKRKKKVKEDDEPVDVKDPWIGSDRDYTYTEMLERLFTLLRDKNPSLAVRKRHTLPPPYVVRVGTRKSMWTNFAAIATALHRNLEHVMAFVLAELGTEGSIDGSSRLVVKGRYAAKQIESLLRKYIIEYVTCSMCRNPETTLTRDSVTRLYFIQCEACGSRRSVAPIKSGYHATQRGERKKAKAAAPG